ncbi:hypothetical protein NPIL_63401 [Nephila pilipes]|uniref:Uncharacterized protein n=1 Tax=Nephila pilipes TaxID=299642 RepID=A0A8X6MW06_NEPPI|nr:hypothetical protein NPIL_63401 [Nephila pilipes]
MIPILRLHDCASEKSLRHKRLLRAVDACRVGTATGNVGYRVRFFVGLGNRNRIVIKVGTEKKVKGKKEYKVFALDEEKLNQSNVLIPEFLYSQYGSLLSPLNNSSVPSEKSDKSPIQAPTLSHLSLPQTRAIADAYNFDPPLLTELKKGESGILGADWLTEIFKLWNDSAFESHWGFYDDLGLVSGLHFAFTLVLN